MDVKPHLSLGLHPRDRVVYYDKSIVTKVLTVISFLLHQTHSVTLVIAYVKW